MKNKILKEKESQNSELIAHSSGITLVALIITIIVLLILATVAIQQVSGDGIIGHAKEARLKQEIVNLKEEYELWCTQKTVETLGEFSKEGVTATKEVLVYNETQKENENIYNVMPSLEKSSYSERVEIIKGEMYVKTTDKNEIEWLQEIGILPNPWNIVDGVLKSSETNLLLLGEDGTLVIPGSVTEIAKGAFSNVEGIKKIIIPGSVKTIGDNAFSNNTTLEEVIIEDGVETIGGQAFYSCPNLTTVQMQDSVTNIGGQAFRTCRKLQNVNLSNNITVLSALLFADCGNLSTINLPEKLTTICRDTFYGCTSLGTVKIPKDVTSIDSSAFRGCTSLATIEIDPANQNFASENGILMNKGKTEMIWVSGAAIAGNTFTVPSTVTKIGSGLIDNYTNITNVIIPASVVSIDFDFFNSNVTEVTIDAGNPKYVVYQGGIYSKPDNKATLYRYIAADAVVSLPEVTKQIADYAFYEKRNTLTNITLPSSLEGIGKQAFSGCNKLKEISIGAKVSNLNTLFIHGLDIKVSIDENNPNYKVMDKAICSKDGSKLITVIGNPTTFNIPTGIKEIGYCAFYSKSSMTQVIIPNTVTKIELAAFDNCSGLTKIEIPSSIESIDINSFTRCRNLKEIQINKPENSIPGAPWGAPIGDRVKVIWNK